MKPLPIATVATALEANLTAHQIVRGFAFDFDSSGKLDHLVFYCPGEQIVYIFKSNGDRTFTQRYPTQASPVGTGIGGYNLASSSDRGLRMTTRAQASWTTWSSSVPLMGPSLSSRVTGMERLARFIR